MNQKKIMSNAPIAQAHVNKVSDACKEINGKVIEYYKNLDAKKLILPRNSSRRQYRLHAGNHWAVIRDRIDTPEKLKSYLVTKPVFGVYTSIGLWLNNTVLRRLIKNKRPIRKKAMMNPLLGSDYVVDIDLDFVDHRGLTEDCYWQLIEWGYKDLEIKFTGRGSQIIIPKFYVPQAPHPIKRLFQCRAAFAKLTNRLLDKGFPVDFEVMKDWPTRVVKLIPNTLSKHGTVVQNLSIDEVKTFQPIKIFEPINPESPSKILSIRQKKKDGSWNYIFSAHEGSVSSPGVA